MKRKITIIAPLTFLLLFIIGVMFVSPNRLQAIKEFRGVKVGDRCPCFHWAIDDLRKMNISEPAKFFIFFINDKVNVEAELDDRRFYSDVTSLIVGKGGHFWPSGDWKVAKVFGINSVLSRTRSVFVLAGDTIEKVLWDRDLIMNRSNMWEYDASLIAVTDGQGKILALYKNAKIGEIKRVVKELGL